jgi:EmrB/QacA subfamily drug resistance transporter
MTHTKTPLTHQQILGMFAMSLAVLVVANDFTAFSVALPAMQKVFSADVSTIQWVINGYSLVFGVSIVSGGRMADMYGRRRIFILGATIFAGFSLMAGLATDIWVLLLTRALMGVGGAMMWPATLGMTYALIPEERAGLAGGLILGSAGIGNAVGPLLGGILTDTLGWRWIFLINLPVALIGVLVVLRVIEKDKPAQDKSGFDYGGVALLTAGLLALLLALDLGTDAGWASPHILGLFATCFASMTCFGLFERKMGPKALVPSDVLRNPSFLAAGMVTLLMSAIFFAAILYLPQFMQTDLGFSALNAGIGFLPLMAVFGLTSFVAGSLYEKLGAKLSICGGAAALAAGMFLLSDLQDDTTYPDLVTGMTVLGMGVGLFYSSITTAGITALDPSRASLGGAILYMFQIAGGSIGLGMNTAIVVSAPDLAEGINRAFMLNGVLAVLGLVIALFFVGGRLHKINVHTLMHRHRAHG